MAAQTNLMPVWPGPRVLVPMATDILLVGKPDQNTTYASTKNSYLDLYLSPGAVLPSPFTTSTLGVGAHIMWTLPFSLRSGSQSAQEEQVGFRLVPNRWLVTRFKYSSGSNGTITPPQVTATVLQSDTLFDISSNPSAYNQYPYPQDASFPLRGIGVAQELATWQGVAGPDKPFLQAVGPGTLSWSVAYDNIKNVFSLYDDFGQEAADSAIYTYSIIGWYANPDDDVLSSLPVTDSADWKAALEQGFAWSPGPSVGDVDNGVDAWKQWQQSHGLQGTFNPDSIQLPEQEKAAIIAWHNWQQANGVTAEQPDLPTKLLCHSMVATVNWQGNGHAYGTGVPGDYADFPAVAIGNTSTEAISVYMANKVVEELGEDPSFIPEIERALSAFQKDLLFDLANNEVNKVETRLHNDEFELGYGGQQWVVVRPESTTEDIQATGGQQTIPLNATDTQTLIALNKLQSEVNTLFGLISSQRGELFLLSVKKLQLNRHSDPDIVTKVNDSISAITGALTANLTSYDQKTTQVDSDAKSFQDTLGDQFVLKPVDLTPNAAPNDPVVMLAGGKLDAKLNAPGQYKEDQLLFVRFTGQTVTGIDITYTPEGGSAGPKETIGAAELLASGNVVLPTWNAIPKEVMDLWIELLLLDTSNAGLIASLYFQKAGITPTDDDLTALTAQIQKQQTAPWNSADQLGVHPQALGVVAGINGLLPSEESVAFRTQQPWTPIYLDWKISWFPSSMDSADALNGWTLGDIDFSYTGTTIPTPPDKLIYEGRTTINTKTAQNIQQKFASFESDPNYQNLPDFIISNLTKVANDIKEIDIVTQSMGGLGKQLATEITSMNTFTEEYADLLGNTSSLFRPVVGSETESGPFFPIRSGHFQVIDLWMVDSFGQIWRGKDPSFGAESPILNIYWSEELTTPPSIDKAETYGQLPPRLEQPVRANPRFLQADNDAIFSNSSDRTSPICGWVMANHLDNSLMVFDAEGNNLGAIIKIQRQMTGSETSAEFSIRWDAVPGSNTPLGAPPNLPNEHLQSFILNLLATASQGSSAYDELMSAIDATLWSMGNFPLQDGNLSILLGRPLAVVRAELNVPVAGTPIYNQSWPDTGRYYESNGEYLPTNPPYMSVPFPFRVGDSLSQQNGVMGYFQADQYDTFYAVYGIQNQTAAMKSLLTGISGSRADSSAMLKAITTPAGFTSGYVKENHLISIAPGDEPVKLTVLIDPSGDMPVISGGLPTRELTLPTGPVGNAMKNFTATFRTGPLLLDPDKIRMPTPAEVRGNWGWAARKDVTQWNPNVQVTNYTPVATLESTIPTLIEGWLTLSGAESEEI
ncbi:hypothetical protein BTA51_14560 [Hahella sp. CCB-MM4]|uniref:hypothetical protein n=1 Tax=Hahella sp. (strain CCB-MM4) TaxID=1926491 RepID=UPI000B9B4F20|nr:hypothetical protein [Hahella sp. CCB-MM4]OZG72742.1 hypothetical protein BTA51_14560 [Hahella sp. CCB-MM4]